MKRKTNSQQISGAANQSTKQARMLGPMPYEEMLAEDVRAAKRNRDADIEWITEPTIDLGIPRIKRIKVASLGPHLHKRFRYR